MLKYWYFHEKKHPIILESFGFNNHIGAGALIKKEHFGKYLNLVYNNVVLKLGID
jgi:hypothetical protein